MFRRYAFLLIVMAAGLAGLTGCGTLAQWGVPLLNQNAFTRTLAIEYGNLADYEEQNLNNAKIAAYFRAKADKARHGDVPLPDDPHSVAVPETAKQDLYQAYASLIRILQTGAWTDNGALAAMAQTRFDCWLAIQIMEDVPGAGEGCRDKFYEAMGFLTPSATGAPPAETAEFIVYFKKDHIGLSQDGMDNVRRAASALQAHAGEGWVVLLDGYAAPGERGETARNLSIRRSMAVRNALAQQGVGMDDIIVGHFGKAPDGKEGDAGHERRVEIHLLPRDQAEARKSTKAKRALPEHFGKTSPVF
jgi:OOP family OmpA-OmpF porin